MTTATSYPKSFVSSLFVVVGFLRTTSGLDGCVLVSVFGLGCGLGFVWLWLWLWDPFFHVACGWLWIGCGWQKTSFRAEISVRGNTARNDSDSISTLA